MVWCGSVVGKCRIGRVDVYLCLALDGELWDSRLIFFVFVGSVLSYGKVEIYNTIEGYSIDGLLSLLWTSVARRTPRMF